MAKAQKYTFGSVRFEKTEGIWVRPYITSPDYEGERAFWTQVPEGMSSSLERKLSKQGVFETALR